MKVISSLAQLRSQVKHWRDQGLTIGFVPTMGNLHAGHLSLVDKAQQCSDKIVVSIFVNPLQFNDQADLDVYPRTFESDSVQLMKTACDIVFVPDVLEVYPQGMEKQSKISVPGVGDRLCGANRPGHFDGVATVVAKLFNIVMPDIAVFGEKDYQQLLLIKKLVVDFNMPIKIVQAEVVRQADGLALSSRNQYLSITEKKIAVEINQTLLQIKQRLEKEPCDFIVICEQAKQAIEQKGFAVEYIEICRETDLMPARSGDKALRIMIGAQLGPARLIDNIGCYLAC
ncbi:MAG: pantoate--beta-alanine ligase [Methylophagaceae bacterium]|jgi:pantoate--beta-alanine ligase